MKKLNKLLIMCGIFISLVLLTLNSYTLCNSNNEIDKLGNDDKSKVEKFIKKQMKNGEIPGISVTIVDGEKTVYQKGFGYSNIENKKKVTTKTFFEIGSNSKAFTALGILNLQKCGLIKLNEPVTKYIPWLNLKYKGKEASITIDELLHHTSGIPSKSIAKIPAARDNNALERTVKTLKNTELNREPGKKFEYATINYDVLGLIIQKVTGLTYEKYMEQNVMKPLGLSNTYLFRNATVNKFRAQGHKISFLKPRLYNAPVYRGNKPAGYIISNGEDMAKWLKIQMGTAKSKFSKDLIEASHEPGIIDINSGAFYARGWFERNQIIYHPGQNPNYSSFILFNQDKRIGIAVLSNISSEYVSNIADGIYGILEHKVCNEDVSDLNKNADFISVIVIGISALILLVTLFFMFKTFRQILSKERKYCKKGIMGIFIIYVSLIFILGLSYCLYIVPYFLNGGVTWGFIYVWFPKSVIIVLCLIYADIWAMYINFFIRSFYKKVN
jgi:putative ATP-binding cassette transporter